MPCEVCCPLGLQESVPGTRCCDFVREVRRLQVAQEPQVIPIFAVSLADSDATWWTVIFLVYHNTSRMNTLTSDVFILATKKEIKFPSQKEGFQAQAYPHVGMCYNGSHRTIFRKKLKHMSFPGCSYRSAPYDHTANLKVTDGPYNTEPPFANSPI